MKITEVLKRFAVAVLVWGLFPVEPASAEELNSIVLRVNDEITTLYDYRERKQARERAIAESEIPTEERRELAADAAKATMREILDEMLLLSRARQLIIEPSKAELDEAMDGTRNRMNLTTEEAFANALRGAGMTLADFRERTSRSIRVNAVIQREVRSKVEVDDDWLQRAYRQRQEEFRIPARANVQEIVIPAEKLAGQPARDLAEQMRSALSGGEAMADVVARLGGGDATGPVDLGWVKAGELAPALEAAVEGLPVGGVSSPVEARGGLHLLQVLERTESSLRPFAEVKEELGADEQKRRFEEQMRDYLATLEERAYLLENTPPEAVGYREVIRENPNDPLAAFAPKREPKAPAPPPVAPIAPAPQAPLSSAPEPGSPPE